MKKALIFVFSLVFMVLVARTVEHYLDVTLAECYLIMIFALLLWKDIK